MSPEMRSPSNIGVSRTVEARSDKFVFQMTVSVSEFELSVQFQISFNSQCSGTVQMETF